VSYGQFLTVPDEINVGGLSTRFAPTIRITIIGFSENDMSLPTRAHVNSARRKLDFEPPTDIEFSERSETE
jgi:hypothetical protein